MKRISILCVSTLLGMAPAALAQSVSEVKFPAGQFGTMLEGTITGKDYADYKLKANGGQKLFPEMKVAKTNGNGTIYYNILPPGSNDVAIFNGSMDDDNNSLTELPETGEYTVRVYLMGNDEDAGKSVTYNLDVSIQ